MLKISQHLDTSLTPDTTPAAPVPSLPARTDAEPEKEKDIRDLTKPHTQSAIETLAEIMNDKTANKMARITAANSVLDRGWGKPKQATETTVAVTYQDLLKGISEKEQRYLEVVDAQVVPPLALPAPASKADFEGML